MTDIVNPEYAVERLKILAEDIRKYDGEDCDPQEIYEIMLEFARQDAEDAQL